MSIFKNRIISIKNRIFITILAIVVLILGSIMIIFNLYINFYIKHIVKKQLEFVEELNDHNIVMLENLNIMSTTNDNNKFIITEIHTLMINGNYDLINEPNYYNFEEVKRILTKIKDKKYLQNLKQNMLIKTGGGSYYISGIKVSPSPEIKEDLYLLFYADISGITNFTTNTNLVLILIMLIAIVVTSLLTAILSEKITLPINELEDFAYRIGKGDFSRLDIDFKDKELRKLAINMNYAAKQLEEFDREQKVFFQNASHELRTPLMSIKCYAEGLKYNLMDKDKVINTIIAETDRLSEMVEDLLYVSRIDNISGYYKDNVIDLRELISIVGERQKNIAKSKGIEFEYNFDEDEVMFKCNEKYIERAINNLISNAIKYAKSKITLYCKKEKNKIIISVIDDGNGVCMEDLPHIFERFYKGKNGNHGIGLSIVRTIINQHNGIVYLKNSTEGANFTIELTQ